MPIKRLAGTLLCCSAPLFSSYANASYANDNPPVMAYTSPDSELMQLDNGVILEGSDLSSIDTYTSGFRLTAGFSPWRLPQVDIGAEIAYRESEEVPLSYTINPLVMDTLSLGGAIVAGVRMGAFSVYAKSGITEWRGESYAANADESGTALLQGFGATMTINRLVSRFEYERIDAPTLSHLNMLSASLHMPF
ncbi:hypothetical protein LCGC14_0459520 [marine sediment metagenome]|uniref:Outer membrane protein beta-barrel domain-containing protein n=2 Tax=root TaxID=1 RepID=A0A0F9SY67_9ZZZZ|nr:hypothetical protein [Halomonas sp.]MCL5426912.1 hypothetical protein [Gammaproteobacteria bacterium]HDZ49194.1 hypothetical protein [Halomonas sp.]HEB04237.1 hypothetical protein [Halomonas sp.]